MLGWQVRARLKFPKFHVPDMSLEDVDRMDDALRTTFANTPVTWYELQREWLVRLALHHGCSRWGYKAPQDFMHLSMLETLYPGMKVVFIYRDPRKVMASYKNIRADNEDGHPGQYHPIVYSLYWRMALNALKREQLAFGDRLCEIKFETLVQSPQDEGERLATFLGTRIDGEVQVTKPNSSFSPDRRKGVTPTEIWICERVSGDLMREKGYEIEARGAGCFRVRDIPDFIRISFRFSLYQLLRIVRNRSAWVSIKAYIFSLFRTKSG